MQETYKYACIHFSFYGKGNIGKKKWIHHSIIWGGLITYKIRIKLIM